LLASVLEQQLLDESGKEENTNAPSQQRPVAGLDIESDESQTTQRVAPPDYPSFFHLHAPTDDYLLSTNVNLCYFTPLSQEPHLIPRLRCYFADFPYLHYALN